MDRIWIAGIPVDGRVEVKAQTPQPDLETLSFRSDVEFSTEFTVRFDHAADRDLFRGLGDHGSLQFKGERQRDPGHRRFALWGGRRRWIQIGSPEDHAAHRTRFEVTIPKVTFQ